MARTCFRRARDTLRAGLAQYDGAAGGSGGTGGGGAAGVPGNETEAPNYARTGTCREVSLADFSDFHATTVLGFWGSDAARIPEDQAMHACTFRHWDDHITFASKAKRFPTGRGPRAITCTQDCSFCAVK